MLITPLNNALFVKLASQRYNIACYLTTHIHIVGKKSGGENFINDGISEYEKRLSSTVTIQNYFHKTDDELVAAVTSQKYKTFCMDENGLEYSSREFSKLVFQSFEQSGAHITFVIGGFSGLPKELKVKDKYHLISMSKMTWTHQMARLLLVEQLYRANEIHKGSKYHKD
jgi:23S rRNA (pseudouridine1915-N3)-methyltransferase